MLSRILTAVLNGIITFIILIVIAMILNEVGLSNFGAIIERFAWIIAVLVGALTFLGHVPNYWNGLTK